ncbi:vamp7B [Symbiodinium natans]|uniref:Vamp7B protein n=1 Tax=Symbiodinium natans TaxID=878477 RepID=A0A812I342_9DINO|nr:vamp7B [Symbiodinium natans]
MDRERPQIIYALVIRGQRVVLAEYTALAGNFQQATIQILQKLESTHEWKSYIYGEYAFHYIVDQSLNLWFVCMAERLLGRRIPFGFLQAVQDGFLEAYTAEQVESAIAYGMQENFRERLRELMERYNSQDVDRVQSMMAKVQHINDHLMDSIDKILERQEKIDLLVHRSEVLSASASSFRRDAEHLRRRVWWQNARTMAVMACVLVIAILVVVLASCGFSFSHC